MNIVTILLQNFMKLAIFYIHTLYFQCVKGSVIMAQINAINSINSQVSFSGRKKPSIGGYGGNKTMAEKYGDTNISTANAGTVLVDYIVDHIIEFGLTAAALIGTFVKGKDLMSGVSGAFVDSAKQLAAKQDGAGLIKSVKAYAETVKKNIDLTKQAEKIKDTLTDNIEAEKIANSAKEVMEGSVIDKIAKKADNEKSLVSKVVNFKPIKRAILGQEQAAVEGAVVKSADLKTFFAQKLGLERGADVIDIFVATSGAGTAAGIVNIGADAGTDLNDEQVAHKAKRAERIGKLKELYNAI